MLQRSDPTLAEARATTRSVARTFSLACRLLPRGVRDDVYRLYLVFRTLDDLVDDHEPGAEAAVAAVEAWAHGGPATSREARLLAAVDSRRPLPRDAILDFCVGMRSDLAGASFVTEADVDEYCYRVAGTVGVTMGALLGTDGDARDAAAALGCAMQRTNILRDIDEDGVIGRVYLAQETLERFGGEAALAPGRREPLLRDQIARADALYDQGCAGITQLRSGRPGVRAAAAMYREILRQIERDGYGSRAGRAVVPLRRKLAVAVPAASRPLHVA